jgi:phospholipid/cholesterol/gamma-HCH transport system ATP-binding protein
LSRKNLLFFAPLRLCVSLLSGYQDQVFMVSSSAYITDPHGPLVQLERIGIDFGRQRVLRDIDLSIPRGQTLAVIGESGCGKTVLLKTIIGLLRPNRGAVYFDGQDLSKLHEREMNQQRIRFGFLFQQAALFDSMTIAQNVSFPLRQHTRKKPAEMRQIVAARLAEVGLPENILSKKPAELSGGMRKRVGLARALALEPEIILYDEPTTGLDPIMSDVINELILNTRRRHPVTSIVVTHDMRTAQKVADRVVMLYPLTRLEDGQSQVLYDGPPKNIEQASDQRVSQFVRGEAGQRLMEMRQQNGR